MPYSIKYFCNISDDGEEISSVIMSGRAIGHFEIVLGNDCVKKPLTRLHFSEISF
jgi:hypothetical protein